MAFGVSLCGCVVHSLVDMVYWSLAVRRRLVCLLLLLLDGGLLCLVGGSGEGFVCLDEAGDEVCFEAGEGKGAGFEEILHTGMGGREGCESGGGEMRRRGRGKRRGEGRD